MAKNTRTELGTDLTSLTDPGAPKISKALLKAYLQKLVDSAANLRSDAWLPPVKNLLNTPPGSPTEGDRYAVGPAPTGAWNGHDSEIAEYTSGSWVFDAVPNNAMVLPTDAPTTALVKQGGVFRPLQLPREFRAVTITTASTTSGTLATVPGLSAPVLAGHRYRVEVELVLQAVAPGDTYKAAISHPACTMGAWTLTMPDSALGLTMHSNTIAGGNNFGAAPGTVPFIVRLAGVFAPSANGTLAASWSADGSTAVDVLPGSTIRVTDITD